MNDILFEFEKYISNNKEVLSVLPVNTKKNKSIYLEKVEDLEQKALKMKEIIWDEIKRRYYSIIDVKPNPRLAELVEEIKELGDVELYNELNTPYEKLGIDRIAHSLNSFFEGDLYLVNDNIKLFVDTFKEYGINLTVDDFNYSPYVNEYMVVFFEEYNSGREFDASKLKKHFETIYWKCPDIVIHIELNIRYLYYENSKKIEKELDDRNEKRLEKMHTDKNGLVKQYFELNKALIKQQRTDPKYIMDKFISGEWRVNDFNDKEMSVLYDRLSTRDYYAVSKQEQEDIDISFGKLLNTLQEYSVYKKYQYIIDDIKEKYKNKESFKGSYDNKNKELRKKEGKLLKETKKQKRILKLSNNFFFKLFRKKLESKMYEFPISSSAQIKELKTLYMELDEEKVNARVYEFVDENCSIKYMFKIATSFYSYAYSLIKKNQEENEVAEDLKQLLDFIDQPYKVMLNNVRLMEEPEIISIISNRYKILNIKLEREDLQENLETLIQDVEKIVNFQNIRKSKIDLDDASFIEKVKPMIADKNR